MNTTQISDKARNAAMKESGEYRGQTTNIARSPGHFVQQLLDEETKALREEVEQWKKRFEYNSIEISFMNDRVHRGEHSENCPFCKSYVATGHSQQVPMCHLCQLESKRDQLRQQLADAQAAADNNGDWFDQLVNDLAKLLGCERKASSVVESASKLRQQLLEAQAAIVVMREAIGDSCVYHWPSVYSDCKVCQAITKAKEIGI